jgi:hypothetical protein
MTGGRGFCDLAEASSPCGLIRIHGLQIENEGGKEHLSVGEDFGLS